jgi:hypothetical protein
MVKKRANTLQYWQVDGAEFPAIRAVALTYYFSTVTSSAASERGFSTMGFVHSKMRNLGSGKGKQLVFIKTNVPQLLSDQAGAEWEESEESDGESCTKTAKAYMAHRYKVLANSKPGFFKIKTQNPIRLGQESGTLSLPKVVEPVDIAIMKYILIRNTSLHQHETKL